MRPDDLFARYVDAACRYHSGDAAGAVLTLRELLEVDGGDQLRRGPVLLDLGDALVATGELSGAMRAFAEAARCLPDDPRPAARLRKITQIREFSR
jgi:Flp pilus assembly protein TadD